MTAKKTALVIGGTRGVGLEIARESIRRGMRTFVVGRDFREVDGDTLGKMLRITADVTAPEGIERLEHERIWLADHVFWVAGAYLRGPLAETDEVGIDRTVTMHQTTMVKFVRRFHRSRLALREHGAGPYTLGVIGSVSSFLLRKHEAVYAMAKAGQAEFLRQFAPELAEDLPGSRVLLINCARLASEPGAVQSDRGGVRINPAFVTRLAWDVLGGGQGVPYREINLFRSERRVIVGEGPERPETP